MEYQVKVKYSEGIVKEGVWRFWLKSCGLSTITAIILIIVLYELQPLETASSAFKLLFGCSIGLLLLEILIFVVYRHRALSLYRKFPEDEATWSFTDEHFGAQSSLGKVEYKWSLLKKILRFPKFWLITYPNGAYSTLPLENVSAELKEFIIQKVKSTGGKVD